MEELTIAQLSERTGLSARNIRLYQTRGMIDPPRKRGREAVYGEDHVERLELIQRMLADGMTRDLVQRVLTADQASIAPLLGLQNAATHPAGLDVRPAERVTRADLQDRLGDVDVAIERAVGIGLLRPVSDDEYEAPVPELLDIAAHAVKDLGIPLDGVLEIADFATAQVDAASTFFVDVMRRHVWERFDEAGRPAEQLEQIARALKQPHVLPGRIYDALFARALVDASRRVTAEVLDRETQP